MGLCCSKPAITVKPMELPVPEPILEQNPMIPVQDEITIVHVVAPDVAAFVDVIIADPVIEDYITASVPSVTEIVIIDSEPRKDATRPPCQIELYKEAIGVIEKHSREPTAI